MAPANDEPGGHFAIHLHFFGDICMRPERLGRALGLAVLLSPAVAWAGMPDTSLGDIAKVVTLSEHAEWRLQGISFFLMGVLLSALALKFLWNHLAKDFKFLPVMSYPKALGAVVLWGFLFILVLTMISGARELMTPGAWKKRGSTYTLEEEKPPASYPAPTGSKSAGETAP